MSVSVLTLLAAKAAATAPGSAGVTPAPATVPSNFQFNTVSFASQHPALLWIVQTFFILCAVGLVALMAVQTTKNEGLSGSIGGRAESAYRGRLGFDQQLARLTGFLAVAFVIFSIAYFLVTR